MPCATKEQSYVILTYKFIKQNCFFSQYQDTVQERYSYCIDVQIKKVIQTFKERSLRLQNFLPDISLRFVIFQNTLCSIVAEKNELKIRSSQGIEF